MLAMEAGAVVEAWRMALPTQPYWSGPCTIPASLHTLVTYPARQQNVAEMSTALRVTLLTPC